MLFNLKRISSFFVYCLIANISCAQILLGQYDLINLDCTPGSLSNTGRVKKALVQANLITTNDDVCATSEGSCGIAFLFKNKVAKEHDFSKIALDSLSASYDNALKATQTFGATPCPHFPIAFTEKILEIQYNTGDFTCLQVMPRMKGDPFSDEVGDIYQAHALDKLPPLFKQCGAALGKLQVHYLQTSQPQVPQTITHYDFHFGNIMFDKATNKFSLIDLDSVGYGHPLIDPLYFLTRNNNAWDLIPQSAPNPQEIRTHHSFTFLSSYLQEFSNEMRGQLISKLEGGVKFLWDQYDDYQQKVNFSIPFFQFREPNGPQFNSNFLEKKSEIEDYDGMIKDIYAYCTAVQTSNNVLLQSLATKYPSHHASMVKMATDLYPKPQPTPANNPLLQPAVTQPLSAQMMHAAKIQTLNTKQMAQKFEQKAAPAKGVPPVAKPAVSAPKVQPKAAPAPVIAKPQAPEPQPLNAKKIAQHFEQKFAPVPATKPAVPAQKPQQKAPVAVAPKPAPQPQANKVAPPQPIKKPVPATKPAVQPQAPQPKAVAVPVITKVFPAKAQSATVPQPQVNANRPLPPKPNSVTKPAAQPQTQQPKASVVPVMTKAAPAVVPKPAAQLQAQQPKAPAVPVVAKAAPAVVPKPQANKVAPQTAAKKGPQGALGAHIALFEKFQSKQ
jgi:hypothetical protein